MGMVLITETGTFTPADYGIREGDLMTVICVGGGGGGGSAAGIYISQKYIYSGAGGAGGVAGSGAGSGTLFGSLPGGGGGGFGAGGGGGAAYSSAVEMYNMSYCKSGGGGGNAGELRVKSIFVSEEMQDSPIAVTIGQRGAGGAAATVTSTSTSGVAGNTGATGGSTSFGNHLTAGGGYGGYGANAGAITVSPTYGTSSVRAQQGAMALGASGGMLGNTQVYVETNVSVPVIFQFYTSYGGGGAGGFVLGGYVGGDGASNSGNCGGSGRYLTADIPYAESGTTSALNGRTVIQNADAMDDLNASRGHGLGGSGTVAYGSGLARYQITSNGSAAAIYARKLFDYPKDGSNIGGIAGNGCVVVMW